MANQRDNTDERQARLDLLIEQFRTAEKHALLKRGIRLWTRTETQDGFARYPTLPAEKIN
jgi:hypothetical protein